MIGKVRQKKIVSHDIARPGVVRKTSRIKPKEAFPPEAYGIAIVGALISIVSIIAFTGWVMIVGILFGLQFTAPLVGRFLKTKTKEK